MNVIDIRNLTKDYGNHKGIFDISLTVKEGEIVGFIGANGAGKTTTIRHLMGFIKPHQGTASLLGMDCFDQSSLVQEKVGYLPGEMAFMDHMTGYQFIEFMSQMKNMKDMSYAKELIHFLELDASVKIKKMSKGMKQKVGLVIAFMDNCPILILDEPTSGLDPLMQNKFVELIKKEKELGKTILMSSHIFEEIENTCDRIVMIKDGRIVADEKMGTIKKGRSKYYEITFVDDQEAISFQKIYPHSTRENNVVSFLLKGNIKQLLQELNQYHVEDINARHQTLEEVFMQYYGGVKK